MRRRLHDLEDLTTRSFPGSDRRRAVCRNPGAAAFCCVPARYTTILLNKREELGRNDVAIIRVEQLYPFPLQRLTDILRRYSDSAELFWVQEEPENMGAWYFVEEQMQSIINPGGTADRSSGNCAMSGVRRRRVPRQARTRFTRSTGGAGRRSVRDNSRRDTQSPATCSEETVRPRQQAVRCHPSDADYGERTILYCKAMTKDEALGLAEDWVAAWNKHDLDLIMAHYDDAVELTSPVAAQLLGDPDGKVVGKTKLRAYFQRALEYTPNFTSILKTCSGV